MVLKANKIFYTICYVMLFAKDLSNLHKLVLSYDTIRLADVFIIIVFYIFIFCSVMFGNVRVRESREV